MVLFLVGLISFNILLSVPIAIPKLIAMFVFVLLYSLTASIRSNYILSCEAIDVIIFSEGSLSLSLSLALALALALSLSG